MQLLSLGVNVEIVNKGVVASPDDPTVKLHNERVKRAEALDGLVYRESKGACMGAEMAGRCGSSHCDSISLVVVTI